MSDAFWHDLFVTVPPTLTGLATLLYVLKANRLINGKMSELIEHIGAAKKLEGQVETLTEIQKPKVIMERRVDPPKQP